ncbi:MAG: aldehyde dehydrogenase family protein [Steroidobacteraceae bacterium]
MESQLADAFARRRALCGGRIRDPRRRLYCRPTVLVDVDHGMHIAAEETFGPIVPVMPFDDVEQAIALANDEYGLSACVLAGTIEEAIEVGRRIDAGGISINDGCMTYMTYEGERRTRSGIRGSAARAWVPRA